MSEKDVEWIQEQNRMIPDLPEDEPKISLSAADLVKDDELAMENHELVDDTPLGGMIDSVFNAINCLDPNYEPSQNTGPKKKVQLGGMMKDKMAQLKQQRQQRQAAKIQEEAQLQLNRQQVRTAAAAQNTVSPESGVGLQKKVVVQKTARAPRARRRFFTVGRVIRWTIVFMILFGAYRSYQYVSGLFNGLNLASIFEAAGNLKDKIETGMDGIEIPGLPDFNLSDQETSDNAWSTEESTDQEWIPETEPEVQQPEYWESSESLPETYPETEADESGDETVYNAEDTCVTWGGSYRNGVCTFDDYSPRRR